MGDRQQRYPSDASDEQWALIEPLLPPVKTGGRPEKHSRRAVVDAILYVVRTGCAWRQLPADFPPWQTVYWYFNQWEQAKVTEKILPVVRGQLRVQEGRDPEPSAVLIVPDRKGADTVGSESRGYNAGKRINGRRYYDRLRLPPGTRSISRLHTGYRTSLSTSARSTLRPGRASPVPAITF
jgi:transposase